MTQDEAITENCKYFRTTLQIQAMTRSEDEIRKMAAAQADLYVALGMLKLDESDRTLEALCHHEAMPNSVFLAARLESLGLKIVVK